MLPCKYRQLSVDHWDTEVNFKFDDLFAEFCLYVLISEKIYGCLLVMDIWDNDILSERKSHSI